MKVFTSIMTYFFWIKSPKQTLKSRNWSLPKIKLRSESHGSHLIVQNISTNQHLHNKKNEIKQFWGFRGFISNNKYDCDRLFISQIIF